MQACVDGSRSQENYPEFTGRDRLGGLMRTMLSILAVLLLVISTRTGFPEGIAVQHEPVSALPNTSGSVTEVAPSPSPAAPPELPKAGGYEMTTYYVAFMRKGPAWTAERTAETEKVQQGHMALIRKLADEGKLVIAGPFADDGDLRGLFIFRVGSMAEAQALCDADPAVRAGRLKPEIHPWYAAKNIYVTPTAQ